MPAEPVSADAAGAPLAAAAYPTERVAAATVGPDVLASPGSPAAPGEGADEALTPAPQRTTDHHPARTAIPRATVASFERLTGVDLGFVPVNRAPRVATTAAEIGARAYTSGGVVHLPADAGPLERSDNEALLMHELAHVAQQRAQGAAATASPEDDEQWERQADAIERAFRGEDVTPDEWEAAVAELSSADSVTWTAEDGFVSAATGHRPAGLQRKPMSIAEPVPELGDAFAAPYDSDLSIADSATQPLTYAEPTAIPEPLGTHPSPVPEPPAATRRELGPEELEGIALQVSQLISVPRLDVHDPVLLENLALDLYDHVRSLLRHELLVDRERSGVLTEFHQE